MPENNEEVTYSKSPDPNAMADADKRAAREAVQQAQSAAQTAEVAAAADAAPTEASADAPAEGAATEAEVADLGAGGVEVVSGPAPGYSESDPYAYEGTTTSKSGKNR